MCSEHWLHIKNLFTVIVWVYFMRIQSTTVCLPQQCLTYAIGWSIGDSGILVRNLGIRIGFQLVDGTRISYINDPERTGSCLKEVFQMDNKLLMKANWRFTNVKSNYSDPVFLNSNPERLMFLTRQMEHFHFIPWLNSFSCPTRPSKPTGLTLDGPQQLG